jgi:hypothetical protein
MRWERRTSTRGVRRGRLGPTNDVAQGNRVVARERVRDERRHVGGSWCGEIFIKKNREPTTHLGRWGKGQILGGYIKKETQIRALIDCLFFCSGTKKLSGDFF